MGDGEGALAATMSHRGLTGTAQPCLEGHSLCTESKAAANLTGHFSPPSPSARMGSGWKVRGQARPIICQALMGPACLQPSACWVADGPGSSHNWEGV